MRRLARRLDVTPMALYNHVDGRADLERLVVDAIFVRAGEVPACGQVSSDLSQIGHRLRRIYLAHPRAMPLVQTVAPTGTGGLVLLEAALRSLTSAGYDIERSRRVWVGLVSLVNGHVAYELQRHFSDPGAAEGVPEELTLLRSAITSGPLDGDASFDHALASYLAGLEAAAEADGPRRRDEPAPADERRTPAAR